MSSSNQQSQGREYIVNLNQKFDNQFSNVNNLLDKVIDKNNPLSYTTPSTTQNVHLNTPNMSLGTNYSNIQGSWQPYTSFASPSNSFMQGNNLTMNSRS